MESLERLPKGKKASIRSIQGSTHFQSRAVSVGLIPGNTVEILLNQTKRPLLLYCRNTVLALDREDCKQIQVEVIA